MSIKDCTDSCSQMLSAVTCTTPQSRMWQHKEDEDNSADVTDRQLLTWMQQKSSKVLEPLECTTNQSWVNERNLDGVKL